MVKWDDVVIDKSVVQVLRKMVTAVKESDPVKERWDVNEKVATVLVDSSSMALGAVVEIDGSIVEDACWL